MLLRIRATNRNKKLLILIDISDNCFLRFGFNFDPTIGERERERRGRDLPADYGRLYSWSTRNCCVLFYFRAAGVSPSLSLLGFAAAFGKRFKEIKGKKGRKEGEEKEEDRWNRWMQR